MGYEIQLHQSGQRDEGPAIEPFTKYDLYVTKEKSCELYASHNLSTLDEDETCADNLAEFVDGESLENADIVVWPTVSFYHMPRAEDMPNMDAHWSSIRLIPMNWHNRNPLAP
jgi:primary-amine oxidase